MAQTIKTAEVWEDGLRTDPQKKSFEWWYFDSNFSDGSTVVVTFFTKSPSHANGPPKPQIQVVVNKPDGQKESYSEYFPVAEFSADTKKCDVKIGNNTVVGDLKKYALHIELQGFRFDLELEQVAPSYSTDSTPQGKPEYFGWFCAVPHGNVKATVKDRGGERTLTGTGYHDHNWGIIDLKQVCQYWYWGRGVAGDYSTVFSTMVLPKILGGQHASAFYLAKGEKILIEDSNHLVVTKIDIDPPTPKVGHLPKMLRFSFKDDASSADLTLTNPVLIETADPLDGEPLWKKMITRLFSKPLYVRYNCALDLDVSINGEKHQEKGNGLYEIMILH